MLKLLIISSFFLLLTISSCCFTVACDEIPPGFSLRLMRDGKNAVFGPDAFIPVDSISFYKIIESSLVELSIAAYTEDGYFLFQILDEREYLLEIPGILSDTITARLEEEKSGCCGRTLVFDLRRNGDIICEEDCGDIITEIEI